jgi:hypothetical protein
MADIAERRNEFTASDELNTAATSRSRTTATVPSDIDTANDPVIANSQSVQAFGAFELALGKLLASEVQGAAIHGQPHSSGDRLSPYRLKP